MSQPHILVIADVPTWAWARKARAYQEHIDGDEFKVDVGFEVKPIYNVGEYDLIHLFEVKQLDRLNWGAVRSPVIAGITAHVWPTWGVDAMQTWAQRVAGLHANSMLLYKEMQQFHEYTYYVPNGVDANFYQRYSSRTEHVSACHVGKPNPRKGGAMIVEACRMAQVQVFMNQRVSKMAVPSEQVRDMYQNAWLQVTMSDMDGTPNPMLESAACENALISTRIGNMPEFIQDGVNGFLVDRDVDALTEKLVWCREHPDAVAAMGLQARQTVLEGWQWSQQVEHVKKCWRDVLARS